MTVLSHTAEPDGASYTTCDVPCVITNTASNLTVETPAGFELAYDGHPWPRVWRCNCGGMPPMWGLLLFMLRKGWQIVRYPGLCRTSHESQKVPSSF